MDTRNSTLCRICLEDGATCPIFEDAEDEEHNIPSKILLCTNEKIKDILGFPRSICKSCNKTLDTVCKFILKYKESNKILENSLLVVKQEDPHLSGCSDHDQSEVEIEIDAIKAEPIDTFNDSCDETQCLADLIKPSSQIKITKVKKEKKPRINKNNHRYKTNNIASSILEGDFSWNGVKWCLGSTIIKKVKKPQEPPVKRKREIKIEIPKVKLPPPPKLCDLCGEVFKTQDKLSLHKRKVHFKKPVKCPECPRMCASDYYLTRHIKRKHETSRDFVCSACGRGFAFKGELSNHYKNVHDKQLKPKKTYKCQICNKIYKCAKSVLVHERSVHTGQRPAMCSVCGSSFYHEDYLKEHMRLHTGETPFKCPVCGRGYAQRCNMKSHLRIHRISELDAVTLSKLKPNYLKLLKV